MLCSSLVYAIPELPMIIDGNVTINEKPAKIGTEIIAKLNDKEINKVKITEKGKFTLLLQKLNEGDTLNLYVDNIDTKETISYNSGDFKQLNLNVKKSYLFYYITGALIIIIIIALFLKKRKR